MWIEETPLASSRARDLPQRQFQLEAHWLTRNIIKCSAQAHGDVDAIQFSAIPKLVVAHAKLHLYLFRSRAGRPVFPAVDQNGVEYAAINHCPAFCAVQCNGGNLSDLKIAKDFKVADLQPSPVPVNNAERWAGLEPKAVAVQHYDGGAIAKQEGRLLLLFEQLPIQRKDSEQSDRCRRPPAKRGEPTLDVAIFWPARCPTLPREKLRQEPHYEDKCNQRERRRQGHAKITIRQNLSGLTLDCSSTHDSSEPHKARAA